MSSKTSINTIMNVIGGGAIAAVVAYAAGTYYIDSTEPQGCFATYQRGATFGYRTSDGRLMSAIEVQAQAGAFERGLMENSNIIEAAGGPATSALQIKLGRANQADPESPVGIDFAWRPPGLKAATAACLRYSVFLPDNFDFGSGGSLPGLYGGIQPPPENDTVAGSFAIWPRWNRDAYGEFVANSPTITEVRDRMIGYRKLNFTRGRWATIEQEVVLNTPDINNGVLKAWLDGVLIVDEKNMRLRDSEATLITGISARASFAGTGRNAPEGDKAQLQLSPLEISWREIN